MDLRYWLSHAVDVVERWGDRFGPYTRHPAQLVDDAAFAPAFTAFAERMRNNYPFFHPRYAGQMVRPPHPAAIVGYLTAMLHNPNNHAAEGGPATTEMERECVASLAAMFGLRSATGHLTSSGTIGNLEALYVARQSHPGRGVAFSSEAHYTHRRMCHVLGMPAYPLPVDSAGRLEVDALERELATGRVGTVVVTAGTTGLGAVDPVHEVLPLARRHGARVHVDAAYGGFFALLARPGAEERLDPRPWRAIAECDSVVVDPHKHGLQPYGCGAVLFADPDVGRFFAHDSPYTYFTDAELHLGEISLECSRAGAAAAALWLTLKLLPLTPEGFGATLSASRRAALRWADLIDDGPRLRLYQRPELDIVTYFPTTGAATVSAVDTASNRVLRTGMTATDDPVFLSVVRVDADALRRRHPDLARDAASAHVLRSVLLKPEAESYLDHLHDRVHELAAGADPAAERYPDPTTDGDVVRPDGIPETSQADTMRSATDTDRLVEVLAGSFHSDPVAVWLFPDPVRRAEILPEFFRAHVDLSLDYDGVFTTADRDAVLLFLPPGAQEKVAAREAELTERFGEIAGEYRDALLAVMARQAERHPTGRHYYVSFGGVAPSAQRRGAGRSLAETLTERADREEVGMYTETSSAGGAGLSRRMGFLPVGEDIVLPDGPVLRPMWRAPR
ncbi:aminotransferase class V-fold PLP-dependent enzyme [Actinophytocola gossypii]|uniref:Aminotransferase class V-fold PLP-dependent enzyme n=1 Tax=Actinophytocola gossypii TaxID=2812003 RepID=A0ABT2J290_9PSEU|nr:aminotransferase class V-fold PLP-dependent enzyme [Actinophytocola gossypii]MCT2581969.1 aminotransferase class V-fold PLP-dependent enzyme [Actinophytocola gossypii]